MIPSRAVALVATVLSLSGEASAGRFHEAPVRGALAYEGLRQSHSTPLGVERELTACTASIIDLPGVGPRVVTARHCDGHEEVVFDERARIKPTWRHEIAEGGPDIAVLDLDRASPWHAMSTRDSSTLREGETLCAFHVSRTDDSLARDRVCAPFTGRTLRFDGNAARLVIAHPFAHGTSGSPLVDTDGRVVGIVTSTTEDAGFAEPIEEAVRVARAPAITTRRDPPPFVPAARPRFVPDAVPAEGQLCLPGYCFRWEM